MILPKGINVIKIEYEMEEVVYKAAILAKDGNDALKFLYSNVKMPPNKIRINFIGGSGEINAITQEIEKVIKNQLGV
jgi:hypothetical protein